MFWATIDISCGCTASQTRVFGTVGCGCKDVVADRKAKPTSVAGLETVTMRLITAALSIRP